MSASYDCTVVFSTLPDCFLRQINEASNLLKCVTEEEVKQVSKVQVAKDYRYKRCVASSHYFWEIRVPGSGRMRSSLRKVVKGWSSKTKPSLSSLSGKSLL